MGKKQQEKRLGEFKVRTQIMSSELLPKANIWEPFRSILHYESCCPKDEAFYGFFFFMPGTLFSKEIQLHSVGPQYIWAKKWTARENDKAEWDLKRFTISQCVERNLFNHYRLYFPTKRGKKIKKMTWGSIYINRLLMKSRVVNSVEVHSITCIIICISHHSLIFREKMRATHILWNASSLKVHTEESNSHQL